MTKTINISETTVIMPYNDTWYPGLEQSHYDQSQTDNIVTLSM